MDYEDVDVGGGPLGPLKELDERVLDALASLWRMSTNAGVWDSAESSPGLDRSPEARRVCDAMREADRALEGASQAIEDYLAHKERGQ
jgi:hypothetical protein